MTEKKTLEARFAEAWAIVENPDLDSVNPHFKSKYASLKATLKCVRDACRPNGIAYLQRLTPAGDGYELRSSVRDAEGGEIALSAFPVENVPNSQAFGSEMTYKKRQQAQADWGIVGDEDDDANAAAAAQDGNTGKTTRKAKTTPRNANGAAKPQSGRYDKLSQLKAQAMELGITEKGMADAISTLLGGKPMKEATDTELRACESYIAGLIRDKSELLKGAGNVD